MSARRAWRAECGFVSLELVLGLVLLVLPVAMVVLTLPTWFARQDVARLAAQEAARQAVITESGPAGQATAAQVAADNGLTPGQLGLAYAPSSTFAPGGVVTARATVVLPVTVFPGLGSVGSFSWTATFSEQVDQYRSLP